jgi:hypothetical protein
MGNGGLSKLFLNRGKKSLGILPYVGGAHRINFPNPADLCQKVLELENNRILSGVLAESLDEYLFFLAKFLWKRCRNDALCLVIKVNLPKISLPPRQIFFAINLGGQIRDHLLEERGYAVNINIRGICDPHWHAGDHTAQRLQKKDVAQNIEYIVDRNISEWVTCSGHWNIHSEALSYFFLPREKINLFTKKIRGKKVGKKEF